MKKYQGELIRVGAGRTEMRYGQSKISVLEIGDQIISKVMVNERMMSFLDVGEELTIWIGRIFGSKYIYAIKLPDGRVIKMGMGTMIGSAALKTLIVLVTIPMLSSGSFWVMIWIVLAGYLGWRTFRSFTGYLSIN